jgi:hypothetical protein
MRASSTLAVLFAAMLLARCKSVAVGGPPAAALAEPSPSVNAIVAALDHVRDPTHWALLATRAPPAGYSEIHRAATAFEVGDYDEVRAYYYGFDAWQGLGSVDAVNGCHGRAVAAGGTLCPSVVLPGRDIGVARGRELVRLFNAPRAGPPRAVMCQPEHHHAFVYYRKGVPVGELVVDLHCPIWEAAPGFEDSLPNDTKELRRICKEAGLFFCDGNEADYIEALARWKSASVETFPKGSLGDWRFKPRALPVAKTRVVSELTPRERRALCVWNVQHVANIWAPRDPRDWHGVEVGGSSAAYRGSALPWQECVSRFPSCSRTLEEVVPCADRAQRGDLWFILPENAHCRPLRACIWGFATSEE